MKITKTPEVTLYTTKGCHLCEKARELVLTVNPDTIIHEVDIAEDDSLMEEYETWIPVLQRGPLRELVWPFGLFEVKAMLSESCNPHD